MVISFDRTVTLEEDFTENKRALRDAINSLTVGNGTSIYDAVFLACQDQLSKEGGRKAIILISDGQNTTSKVRLTEALVAAHQSDAVIYSISNRIGGFFDIRGSGDPESLKRFSLETGGTVYFFGGRSELTAVFAQETRAFHPASIDTLVKKLPYSYRSESLPATKRVCTIAGHRSCRQRDRYYRLCVRY